MTSRCSSAPRMQQVYTPRVKDGRHSNQSVKVNHFNKTAARFSNANPSYYNPENTPAKRKLYPQPTEAEVQQAIQQKLSQGADVNVRQQNNKKAQQTKPQGKNSQKTIQGRKLDFPAQAKPRGISKGKAVQPESVELKRSNSMFSSMHFVDKSVKSTQIISKKQQFDQKFKAAFGHLLDQNEAYLAECRRACIQKARPKDQIFKIKRPTITTTAQDQFYQKSTPYEQHMHPFAQTCANSFGPTKVCGNSTSNEFHAGKHGPKADLATWRDHYKLQGPLFGVTNYANKYPNHGQHQKMVPIATFNEHPMGFPHKTNSTNRTYHKGQFVKKADLATWNNLHPYGNGFNPDRGTTYGTKHGEKDQPPIQQWPNYDSRPIVTDGIFTTENRTKLINPTQHELNEANYCHCGRKPSAH